MKIKHNQRVSIDLKVITAKGQNLFGHINLVGLISVCSRGPENNVRDGDGYLSFEPSEPSFVKYFKGFNPQKFKKVCG